jgi:hypothetical protein
MMKVRIFADTRPGKVEEQINHWFANEAGAVHVVKTETVAAAVAEKHDGGSSPFIVVTIWHEPG